MAAASPDAAPLGLSQARIYARELILHFFGRRARRIQHQSSGLSNHVFLVYHAEGEFVVRICPRADDLAAFLREQWAVARARDAGVPTAEVLAVGQDVLPYPYMLTRRAAGHEATFHPRRADIIREMGRYAACINGLPTSGIGSFFDWCPEGPRYLDWHGYLHGELRLDERLEVMTRTRVLTDTAVRLVHDTLLALGHATWQPRLNHGDLRPKNVLVDEDGTVTAVLDWEDCVSSCAPQWELSLALHDLSVDEKQAFVTGYGLDADAIAGMYRQIRALNVLNYAPMVAALEESGDDMMLDWYRVRLAGCMDLYGMP